MVHIFFAFFIIFFIIIYGYIGYWFNKPVVAAVAVVVLAAATWPPMVLSPSAGADGASSDSFGKMLFRTRTRGYAVCSRRSDAGDCAAEGHVWQQILYHNLYRNVFSASVVAL